MAEQQGPGHQEITDEGMRAFAERANAMAKTCTAGKRALVDAENERLRLEQQQRERDRRGG